LLLSLSDQFGTGPADCFAQADAVASQLRGEYEREYYRGVLWERHGYARAVQGGSGSAVAGYARVRRAMEFFERAEPLRPPGNDDAILRWNSCVRLIEHYGLQPEPEEAFQPVLGDD